MRKRKYMKRRGNRSLAVAVVLAIGLLGIGFANFSNSLTINGIFGVKARETNVGFALNPWYKDAMQICISEAEKPTNTWTKQNDCTVSLTDSVYLEWVWATATISNAQFNYYTKDGKTVATTLCFSHAVATLPAARDKSKLTFVELTGLSNDFKAYFGSAEIYLTAPDLDPAGASSTSIAKAACQSTNGAGFNSYYKKVATLTQGQLDTAVQITIDDSVALPVDRYQGFTLLIKLRDINSVDDLPSTDISTNFTVNMAYY